MRRNCQGYVEAVVEATDMSMDGWPIIRLRCCASSFDIIDSMFVLSANEHEIVQSG